MKCLPRRRQRGLSLLEFTLVVILFSVLVVLAVDRAIGVRVELEQAAVERTVTAMRGALALEFARLIVSGDHAAIHAWADGNALRLLEGRGALGDRAVTDATDIGPGEWVWDAAHGEIVYRVAWTATAGPRAVTGRWRVVVRGDNGPAGLDLEMVESIEWR